MADKGLQLVELADLHGVKQFAERCGLSDVYVYKLRKGERATTNEVLARVFAAYGSDFALIRHIEDDVRAAMPDGEPIGHAGKCKVTDRIIVVVTMAREFGAYDG